MTGSGIRRSGQVSWLCHLQLVLPCQGHFTYLDFSFSPADVGKQGLAQTSVGKVKRLYI